MPLVDPVQIPPGMQLRNNTYGLFRKLQTPSGGFECFVDFPGVFTKDQLISLPTSLEFGQGKNTTFYFLESFRCFRLNKSVLETKETNQARPHLHFAPKIIKLR